MPEATSRAPPSPAAPRRAAADALQRGEVGRRQHAQNRRHRFDELSRRTPLTRRDARRNEERAPALRTARCVVNASASAASLRRRDDDERRSSRAGGAAPSALASKFVSGFSARKHATTSNVITGTGSDRR